MTASERGTEVTVELGPDEIDDPAALRRAVARKLGRATADELEIRKRSIDARLAPRAPGSRRRSSPRAGRDRVVFRLLVRVGGAPPGELGLPHPREVTGARRVVIVGDGPAGRFCAYQLARDGIPSIILERGRPVQPRRRDLKGLNRHGRVDADSNYCFGEGGAGTYSDGKLFTRSHKRGDVRDVLEILVANGASADILVDARPHIGSNRLPAVITAMRARLEAVGVELRFGARVIGLDVDPARRVRGVTLAGGETVAGDAVVLAAGHSARDVFDLLVDHGVALEAKGFAVGVRLEHPQPLIDRIQYGRAAGHPRLPPASYRLAHEVDGRGVFSFCMCPGGWIVPTATEPESVVVNGMSLSRRDSPHANAGLVVSVEPADVAAAGFTGPLAGVELQRAIERAAFVAGGGALRAPATRLTDFLAGRGSTTVGPSSYLPGLAAGDIGELLDGAGIDLARRLRAGLRRFCSQLRGFATEDALLVGVETRTSCPIRIPRRPDRLSSPDLDRLYPAGEGAGHAGGIVSAALDGIRIARAIARDW